MTSLCTAIALTVSLSAFTSPGSQADRAQVPPSEAATLSGSWNLIVETSHGSVPMSIVLEQDGKKIKGTLTSGMGERQVKGEFANGALSLQTSGDEADAWSVSAKLSRDGELIGHLSTPQSDMKFTASRVKREE